MATDQAASFGAAGERSRSPPQPRGDWRLESAPGEGLPQTASKGKLRAHPYIAALVALGVAAVAASAVLYWLANRDFETTDDAFIDGRTVAMSAQVAGAITALSVTDNQLVRPGDLLARIDDRDYRAAAHQAKAVVDQAQAAIDADEAQIPAQRALVDEAQKQLALANAALTFSSSQNNRAQQLVKTGAGTVQSAQQALSDLEQKQAAVQADQAALTQARKQVGVLQAQTEVARGQKEAAEAALETAEANLSRVTLRAPIEGRVTNLTAAVGDYATPGQLLMNIVPLKVWVIANYKETQLADMRPGQPATVEVDVYGRSFPAHVDSIQAGSGTAFSLLPPENATGNYVKIVQRVPVKIDFDSPPDVELGPGMSVVPSVKVR